jgi:hypothetical protein
LKTTIDDARGVVIHRDGSGTRVEGLSYSDDWWDDAYAYIDQGTGPSALTYEEYRDTGFYMRFFRAGPDDRIFMTYQLSLSHQWNPETAIHPHIHYIPMSSGSGVVKFNYAYAWFSAGETFPSSTGWTSGSVTAFLTPSDQYKSKMLDVCAVVPTTQVESSHFIIKIERPGSTDPADTYSTNKDHQTPSANIGVLLFDLHFNKNKPGSTVLNGTV